MERTGGGSIVNLASIMGLVGYSAGLGGGFNPYVPSKGGVLQLTKNLAIDYAKRGIRVNCICPGYIATNLTRSLIEQDPEALSKLEALHPMGRLGTADEIATAALFLASDESSFVTGTPLIVGRRLHGAVVATTRHTGESRYPRDNHLKRWLGPYS